MEFPAPGFMQAVTVGLILLLVVRILTSLLPWPLRRVSRSDPGRRIRVVGVGGGGGNAVDAMAHSRTRGVDYIAANTDAQALRRSQASRKLQLGRSLTHGLGAGGDPDLGRRAAEVDARRIARALAGSQMVFVTAGLGGGTGSGAAPVIAGIARQQGALTIGVVTRPFAFEGTRRQAVAGRAVMELRESVDTLITVPNDRVRGIVTDETSMVEAFAMIDDVLRQAVLGIIDIIAVPGLINLDFADVRTVMQAGGPGVIGVGRASGDDRAVEAARLAVDNTLIEDPVEGASGILLNVTGPPDLRLVEVMRAADSLRASANPDANVIFGASVDASLRDEVCVSVIATGFDRYRVPLDSIVAAAADEPAAPSHADATTGVPERPALEKRDRRRASRRPPAVDAPAASPEEGSTTADAVEDGQPAQPTNGADRSGIDPHDLDVPSFLRR